MDYLYIFVGLQIIYSGFKFIMTFFMALFGGVELFTYPEIFLSLIIYGICVYLGIQFFKSEKAGWYGIASLSTILFVKEFIFAVVGLILIIFGQSAFTFLNLTEIPIPALSMNFKTVIGILMMVVYGIIIWLSYHEQTLEKFKLKSVSKINLIIRVVIISIIFVSMIFGIIYMVLFIGVSKY